MRFGMSLNDENILLCQQVDTLRGAKTRATRHYYDRNKTDVLKIWSLGKVPALIAVKQPLLPWRDNGPIQSRMAETQRP